MAVDITQLQTDADATVNGRWVEIPGFPGLRARIKHFRLPDWIKWLEETRGEFSDDDEQERAFYGAKIIRSVEGLEDAGKEVEWSESTGRKYLTAHESVTDDQSGETVKVYALDAMFFWVRHYANDPRNYAVQLAGN